MGAGASKGAGLPLTEELLNRVHPRTGDAQWRRVNSPTRWAKSLEGAYKVLYPDGSRPGFRPGTVDFFTMLEVMSTVHAGRERLPLDARSLLSALQVEIALGLLAEAEGLVIKDAPHTELLEEHGGGMVFVTTNWDDLIERTAWSNGFTTYTSWPRGRDRKTRRTLRSKEVVVLKLHGSVDWGLYKNRTVRTNPLGGYYGGLADPVGFTSRFRKGPQENGTVLRFGQLEGARDADQRACGFAPPLMATMAFGKGAQIDHIDNVWSDAYWALSRTATLQVIGYGLPADDLEIRTLLRVTSRRAGKSEIDDGISITIRNPSPAVHENARSILGSSIASVYDPF